MNKLAWYVQFDSPPPISAKIIPFKGRVILENVHYGWLIGLLVDWVSNKLMS